MSIAHVVPTVIDKRSSLQSLTNGCHHFDVRLAKQYLSAQSCAGHVAAIVVAIRLATISTPTIWSDVGAVRATEARTRRSDSPFVACLDTS